MCKYPFVEKTTQSLRVSCHRDMKNKTLNACTYCLVEKEHTVFKQYSTTSSNLLPIHDDEEQTTQLTDSYMES